jgi:dUTP pyrophosphatase
MSLQVQIQRLPHCFSLPSYAHPGDAGMDLYAAVFEDLSIPPGICAKIPTGIAIGLPLGYMAFVQPRSGLAAKHSITILNTPGLIDSGYRGEIQVLLINHGQNAFTVKRGDRIAQMLILPVPEITLLEVADLESTVRQAGGFGSSGS